VAKVPFTHLHLHTQYSLLDGAIKHNPLFERVKALGQESVAMTDHGNLFGAVEFHDKARANGVRPILGCEAYIASGSRFDKERRERESSGHDAISHQLLLAMNETGYRNLIFLISKGFLEGFYYKPRIDMDLLREHNEGLITTSGCLSSLVCRKILAGAQDEAWRLAEEFSRIFDGRYYLELQRHGIPAQDQVNAELLKMSSDLRLPLLATNDAHYLEADDHDHHDALLCIGTASNIQNPNRFRFDGHGFFVKSGEEMLELFHDHPGAVHNSMEIAERCDFELPPRQYHMPEFQVPAGMSREQVLERDSWSGLRERLGMGTDEPFDGPHAAYAERLQHELGVIHRTGFAGYFLIVADFVGFAKQRGIPVGPGRGSSAGSLVAWSLGITGVDPLEYNIIFERFLNPERVSIPDIDVDFCVRGRDEVIRYVSDKYDGREQGDEQRRVAQIITFGTLQARAAIRDVGRAFGMPYGEVDRIAKLVPETLGITLEQALQQSEELRERSEKDPQVGRLVQTARKLEGLTRHASTHAAGVVIGKEPLIQQVPLYRDPRTGDVLTQFDGSGVDRVGLVKFDFLGLRNLTVLADAEKHIHAAGYPDFSAERIPLDDELTYDLLSRGDTEGVFQMESQGMTELVMQLKPRRFEEIIPLIALYRPGPLGSGMVDDFVSRRHGRTKVEYLTPELEEILSETLGVIVYQDQVLQIANRLAGYSLSEADLLRRAMGKKEANEMAKQRERFVSGCAENGVSKAKARKLFDLITVFAGYGFAKSHSTAYAFLTYQTAYLKANHPREFLAGGEPGEVRRLRPPARKPRRALGVAGLGFGARRFGAARPRGGAGQPVRRRPRRRGGAPRHPQSGALERERATRQRARGAGLLCHRPSAGGLCPAAAPLHRCERGGDRRARRAGGARRRHGDQAARKADQARPDHGLLHFGRPGGQLRGRVLRRRLHGQPRIAAPRPGRGHGARAPGAAGGGGRQAREQRPAAHSGQPRRRPGARRRALRPGCRAAHHPAGRRGGARAAAGPARPAAPPQGRQPRAAAHEGARRERDPAGPGRLPGAAQRRPAGCH